MPPRGQFNESLSADAAPSQADDADSCAGLARETRSDYPPPQGNDYPLWSPRIWHGMTAGDYWRLLWHGRFQIAPSRWHLGIITLFTSIFNSLLAWIQFICFEWRIRKTELPRQPVFVIGHFRSGTTMLFEFLACDEQFTYPTTYECFSPRHFLLTERLIPWVMSRLLPKRRPMDNMRAGFEQPQEDEFALLSLSAPTIYRRLAFPNQPPPYLETLTFEDEQSAVLRRWQKQLIWFYRAVVLRKIKRLLIKSPVHTGRIARLIKLFPDARFVHIVRNPQDIFPSIKNAWRVLDLTQGFQIPRNEDQLNEFIFDTLQEMYRGFWEQSASLTKGQLCEVKYEDLLADPLNQIRRIYEQLSLGDFDALQPVLENRIVELGDYQRNRFESSAVMQQTVDERWAEYASRYGYSRANRR